MLVQGMDVSEAAVLGVHIHGMAGGLAARLLGVHSVLASDVIEKLPVTCRINAAATRKET